MDAAAGTIRLKQLRRRRSAWLIATIALAAFWISTAWWGCVWWSASRRWAVGIQGCALCAGYWRIKPPEKSLFPPGGRGFYSRPFTLYIPPLFVNNAASAGVGVPIWLFVVGASTMLFYTDRRARRLARRLANDLCLVCGYDLTGIGAGNAQGKDALCPECGNLAPLPAKK